MEEGGIWEEKMAEGKKEEEKWEKHQSTCTTCDRVILHGCL